MNYTYKINGIAFDKIPPYLEKDGFMTPVTADNFTIEEIEVEVVEPAALTAIKDVLAAEIDKLNTKYPTLGITTSDTVLTAIPKILLTDALKEEVVYLKMLYDTVREAQA